MRKKGFFGLLAIVSGGLTALSFPSFNLFWLAWLSLIPLFFAISLNPPKQAFRLGLVAGFAFYGILLYWIPAVPAHYGNMPFWLSLVIYFIFILFLGSFWATFSLVFAKIQRSFPKAAFLIAPFLWISMEFILTYFFSGFPWGLLGYSQSQDIPFIQLSSLTGVYGISFILVLLQSTFVQAAVSRKKAPFFAALALLAVVHAVGQMSLKSLTPDKNSLAASVIQGNVSSDISWDMISEEEIRNIFDDHIELTRLAYKEGGRLIIWPEFTVPLCFSCSRGIYKEFRDRLCGFAQENDVTLLLGTNEASGPSDKEQYFNTAICLHPDLSTTRYFKTHLVPFGEYTPYKNVFFFIEQVTHSIGDITPGKDFVLHNFMGYKFGSPICYEIIFPALVRQFVKKGADFLVTITNDGWYGRTSAPYQHFAIAVFRAVENRRFLLRAATTGVSGMIDPYGRILARSQIMTKAFLTRAIMPSQKMSIYTRFGDVLPWTGLTLALIFFIMSVFNKRRERESHGTNRKIF